MPTVPNPGTYVLEFNPIIPKPEPLYLTNNGEGKQLTVETRTNKPNQEVN